MTEQKLAQQYEMRANAERGAGGQIEINHRYGYVAITLSDESEYFFQGEEVDNLLSEVPDWINEEDYLLAVAQNW